MRNEISGYVYKGDDVHSDYHYGGLPGCPAGPAATRPIGLTDACMNNNNNNNKIIANGLDGHPNNICDAIARITVISGDERKMVVESMDSVTGDKTKL